VMKGHKGTRVTKGRGKKEEEKKVGDTFGA
jgi:hypothetical protein